jgi:hypothetical protein
MSLLAKLTTQKNLHSFAKSQLFNASPQKIDLFKHVHSDSNTQFDFSKILVLNKLTRYEFEKRRNPGLNEQALKNKVIKITR